MIDFLSEMPTAQGMGSSCWQVIASPDIRVAVPGGGNRVGLKAPRVVTGQCCLHVCPAFCCRYKTFGTQVTTGHPAAACRELNITPCRTRMELQRHIYT